MQCHLHLWIRLKILTLKFPGLSTILWCALLAQKQRDDVSGPWKFLGCKCSTPFTPLAKNPSLFPYLTPYPRTTLHIIMINITYMYKSRAKRMFIKTKILYNTHLYIFLFLLEDQHEKVGRLRMASADQRRFSLSSQSFHH